MAILLFTVIIKIVLMPLSLWCQWNSIVMVKIMPELNRIKVKYFGDAETIGEKQTLLNKKHTIILCCRSFRWRRRFSCCSGWWK